MSALVTLKEFRERLQKDFGVKERPFSDLSVIPNSWRSNLTQRYWERLIPPAGKLRVPVPDEPEEQPLPAELLLRVCMKLRINPKEFGLPWS